VSGPVGAGDGDEVGTGPGEVSAETGAGDAVADAAVRGDAVAGRTAPAGSAVPGNGPIVTSARRPPVASNAAVRTDRAWRRTGASYRKRCPGRKPAAEASRRSAAEPDDGPFQDVADGDEVRQ
jgi:hypothetical protein